jgi:HK97 family phage prohead protease
MATLKELQTEDLGRTYRKMLSFEYKRAEDKSTDPDVAGEIEGYAAGLLNIDKGDDLIFPGFFREVVKDDVVVAYQHDITSILGRPLEMQERTAPDYGLWTVSEIVATSLGSDVMKLVRRKILKKMSIGYRLKSGGYSMLNRDALVGTLKDFSYKGEGISQDKQTEIIAEFDRRKLEACFGLFKGDLREYSIVTFPMNERASITGAKDEEGESPLDGLPFSQHPALVMATNKGYIARVKHLLTLRSADSRGLNAAHKEALEIIAGEGAEVAQEARALLDGG